MTPSIYINLEDNVATIAGRIKRQRSGQLVLVCPKHCALFNDLRNLLKLKAEVDGMGKEVFILTMDEQGQDFARRVGFGLRQVPGAPKVSPSLDIKPPAETAAPMAAAEADEPVEKPGLIVSTAQEIKNLTKIFSKKDEPVQSPAVKSVKKDVTELEPVLGDAEPPVSPVEQMWGDDVRVKDTIFPQELEDKIRKEQQEEAAPKSGRRMTVLLLGAALLLLLAVVFVVLPRANIVVYPKIMPITRDIDISIGTAIKEADAEKLLLPAVKLSETMQASDTFQSQGKKEVGNKAEGAVKIYNFSGQQINLKSATTILSVNGKNYRLVPDLVQIKPTKYSNNQTKEIDPASVGEPIEVMAESGGESSNVPAGTRLEITNQVLGSRPQVLYAKSDTPIGGGVSRYLSVVSEQDIANAQNSLKETILSELREKAALEGLMLPENAYALNVTSFTSDKPAGTESPTFAAQMQVSVIGLAVSKDDLTRLIFDRIRQSVAAGKILKTNSGEGNSFRTKSFDPAAEAGVVTVHYEGTVVDSVNVNSLPGELVGKTPTEVNDILTSKPEIERIDVTLAPSWQKTFPWFKQKIKVRVQE